MKGWEALAALIALEADHGAARASELGPGRTTSPILARLERARLVESNRATPRAYWPTARGRNVDKIHAEITPERGGEFIPQAHAGIHFSESHALR